MKGKLPLTPPEVGIVNFEYAGQKVLTTKQLTDFFHCGNSAIRKNFYSHKNEFVKGVDFFKLEKQALADYRAFVRRNISYQNNTKSNDYQNNTKSNAEKLLDAATELLKGPARYFWTKSGVLKLLRHINTDAAKTAYLKLVADYFGSENPVQPPLFEEPVESPQPSLDIAQEILLEFIKLAQTVKDDALREKMARQAAALIFD